MNLWFKSLSDVVCLGIVKMKLIHNNSTFGKKERIVARWLMNYPQIKIFVKNVYQFILWIIYKKKYTCKSNYSIQVIKKENNESFWGYYDKVPLSPAGKYILFYSCKHSTNKKPNIKNTITIILQEVVTHKILLNIPVSVYNWQQGCRLQWLTDDLFIFNDFDDEKKMYVACVWSVAQLSEIRKFNNPIQDSYRQKYYLSLNYQRLMSVCPDYGYRNLPMLNLGELRDITNDGIWKVDYNTGESTLLVSLVDICSIRRALNMECALHTVNHVMISPSGNRFIFIHRYYIGKRRFDRLFLVDSATGNLKLLFDYEMVSHFFWVNDKTIVAYLRDSDGENAYNLIDVDTGIFSKIICEQLDPLGDGHPHVFGDWLITDSYPDKARMQCLVLLNLKTREVKKLGEFFHGLKYTGETRCDLHPRFSIDGKSVFFDSVFSGKRQLYRMSLSQ